MASSLHTVTGKEPAEQHRWQAWALHALPCTHGHAFRCQHDMVSLMKVAWCQHEVVQQAPSQLRKLWQELQDMQGARGQARVWHGTRCPAEGMPSWSSKV